MNEQRYITRTYKYGYKAGIEHGALENVQVDATPFIDKIKKEIKKKCDYESLSYTHSNVESNKPLKMARSKEI